MFTWKPFYEELATAVHQWRTRQNDLIEILHIGKKQGVPMAALQDKGKDGKSFPLKVMDPFTFFSFVNRIKGENRIKLLTIIKDNFHLASAVPSDFDGVPVTNPQNSWFFSYEQHREPHAIDTLWDFAKEITEKSPADVSPDLFRRTLDIRCVGLVQLTMGLFWMRPDDYLAVDKRNRTFLKKIGIEPAIADWPSYLAFLAQVKQEFPASSWSDLSRKAYLDDIGEGEVAGGRHWLFQANPKVYDLVGALSAGKLQTWQVNQYRKEIQKGDRVVLWLSGPDAGVYGLATVTSAVGEISESSAETAFHLEPVDASKPFTGVTLQVDRAFAKSPITKGELAKHKHTKALPVGRQGTNFPVTEKQFHAIEELIPVANDGRRYWIYAPGDKARFWQECQDKHIMVIGYDELADFRAFKSQAEIEQTLKKLWKLKTRPYNHSLAVWEFANVVQPGDIVISKRGRGEYLGYGIVQGAYDYDSKRPEYKSLRRINWIKTGSWTADFQLVVKTLTDITKYPDYVKQLVNTIGISIDAGRCIPPSPVLPALNIILYGPPGTGKTYRLRNHYMEMFTDRQAMPTHEERAAALVKDLSWWEVIALALLDKSEHRASVADILAHPLVAARVRQSSNNNPRAMIWAALQIHTKDECPNVKYTSRSQPLVFEKDETSIWSIDVPLVEKEAPELPEMLARFKNPDQIKPPVACRYRFTTFHQSFSYEDFIEGIKPQMADGVGDAQADQVTYEIKDGVFKEICREAKANPDKQYALFIDEINRGNVASIFGELITLIEDDKRLGGKNELTASLPYSRKEFGVPKNLYLIGTMNTADRSVEALDTALRRRFTFEEMRPDREKVPMYPGGGVDLQNLFDAINARIEQLLDHDHCIGHAYFMDITDLDSLRSVFANKILPLLREYFYGNPAKVGMVLGDRFVLRQTNKRPFAPGSWGANELDEKEVFAFADVSTLTEADFATIYAEARPGI